MTASPTLVAGRYRLIKPLGIGGMGRVWHARDETLGRDVAIKEVIPPEALMASERDDLRRRTLREARAAARLSHPNVVRVYDVFETNGRPWIVMEFVPARSLHEVLVAEGPVDWKRAAAIGLGVLGALQAAHRAGVMHRDVKPSNVLLCDDGRVVLTDFGIATVEGDASVTRPGLVLGSPAYISPERARDGIAGAESDLWSLGATLYAAVEGRSPFERSTAIATLAALASEEVEPPRNAGPLRWVLNGLLRKDPLTRIAAAEAERRLRRVVSSDSADGGRRFRWPWLSRPVTGPHRLPRQPDGAEPVNLPGRRSAPGSSGGLPGLSSVAPVSVEPVSVEPVSVEPGGADPVPPAPALVGSESAGSESAGSGSAVVDTAAGKAPPPWWPAPGQRRPAGADPTAGPTDTGPEPADEPSGSTSTAVDSEAAGPDPVAPDGTADDTAPDDTSPDEAAPDDTPPDEAASDGKAPDVAIAGPDSTAVVAATPSTRAATEVTALVPARAASTRTAVPGSGGSGASGASGASERTMVAVAAPAGVSAGPALTARRQIARALAEATAPDPVTGQATKRQRYIILGVVVAVLLLVVGWLVVGGADDDKPADPRPPAASAVATPAASAPAAPVTPPAGTAAAVPSTAPTPGAGSDRPPPVPGWRDYTDPSGFTVSVPANWRSFTRRTMIYFQGDGMIVGFDQTDQPKPDPVADWRAQATKRVAEGDFPGYSEIRIEAVPYYQKAADWEFTYSESGVRTHVINRGFVVSSKKAYGIWFQAPDPRWADGRAILQRVFDSFRPAPGR